MNNPTRRILIVDDELENLQMIYQILYKAGVSEEISLATSVQQAYQVIKNQLPDLIVTDWEMPEVNGIEFISSIKKNPLTKDIPVIMCTGVMISSENLEIALDAGAIDYLRKPIDRIELIARVKANLHLSEKYQEIKSINETLKTTLNTVEYQRDKIMSSINYAQRIQSSILPRPEYLQFLFPEHFIFYEPRDVVSGDFYWCFKTEAKPIYEETETFEGKQKVLKEFSTEKIILTAVDCTGHGVPGAFMSMVGNSLLNHIIKEQDTHQPNQILNELHKDIRQVLQQEKTQNKDGMDMALVTLDLTAKTLQFAGAKNPLFYIQNGEIHQIKGDVMPIGGAKKEGERIFQNHVISLDTPTTFYIFSDGYHSQFGGEKRRKFMTKGLRNLLLEIHTKPMNEQKEILQQTIQDWMQVGGEKQVDDILVIGVKV